MSSLAEGDEQHYMSRFQTVIFLKNFKIVQVLTNLTS